MAAWAAAATGDLVRLHPHGLDDGVRSATVRRVADLVDDGFRGVEGADAVLLGEGPALRHGVDRVDLVAEVRGDPGGELTDRTEAVDADAAAVRHVRVLHGLPGGREDVAQEEVAVVAQLGTHDDAVDVGAVHTQVLRLSAGDLPVHLRVAVERRTRAVVVVLGGLALRLQSALAHVALAARDREGDDHAVADLHTRDAGADLLDDAHGLVAEDVALADERAEEFVEVQVGAADRCGRHADDGVRRFDDVRVRYVLDGDVALPLPGECLHWMLPFVWIPIGSSDRA
jgi:hypothetical protein